MKLILGLFMTVLCAGLAFSAFTIVDLRKQVHDMDTKLTDLANRPAETPAPAAVTPVSANHGSSTSSTSDPAGTNTPTAFDEIVKDDISLRKPPAGTDAAGGSSINPAAWTDADRTAFEQQVVAVMDKLKQEEREKQEARQTEAMVSRMKDKLKLSDSQAQEISKVVASTMDAVSAIRATMTPENRDEIRPKIQEAMQAGDAQIKTYLTGEQVTAYDAMKKQGGGLFGGGGDRGGDGGNRRRGGNGGGQGGNPGETK